MSDLQVFTLGFGAGVTVVIGTFTFAAWYFSPFR